MGFLAKSRDKSYSVNPYVVPSSDGTALAVGSFVKLNGAVEQVLLHGQEHYLEQVIEATVTDGHSLLGMVVDIEPLRDTPFSVSGYRAGSTQRIVYVCDDPSAVYILEEDDNTAAGRVADSEAGMNCHIALGAASSTLGTSGHKVDSDTPAADANGQLRLLRPVNNPENLARTGARDWEVMIALHQRIAMPAGI